MSGIAEILLNLGFTVSGSDLQRTEVTDRLQSLGVKVYEGHSAKNLGSAEALVYSSAVSTDNPEVEEAFRRKIPVIRRAEMLAELMRMKFGIAVAGTHAKTTCTSMIGTVLERGGLDPTVIVGGVSPITGSNAKLGASEFLVVEADEFDRSFLKLSSTIAVITSLELEHLDCYSDLDDLKEAFIQFANKVPFFGTVVLCRDEQTVEELIPRIERPIITYGLEPGVDVRGVNIEIEGMCSRFTVLQNDRELGWAELSVLGRHNVKNALAAIAVGLELRMPFPTIVEGLRDFKGVKRRFEIKGEFPGGIMVVDDYAHHPTEVRVTLEAAKSGFGRRVIAVFQPHLYSRTRDFHREFGESFRRADILVVAPIYPAREEPIEGISAEMVVDTAKKTGHPHAVYVPSEDRIVDTILGMIQPGDMVITMGAGDIWQEGEKLCRILKDKN